MSAVDYTIDGTIAVLTVNNPPVNPLSARVRGPLLEALLKARNDDTVEAVVIVGGGSTFIAGADISEFGTEKAKVEPTIHGLQRELESFPKLTIAAIHGTALGGGLELALTCHARVAVASARFGLPEVNLGILPGAGGTQRLPRLTGVEAALDLITSGKHISAPEALKYGIIDRIVTDARNDGVAFARECVASKTQFTPVSQRNERLSNIDPKIFDEWRATLSRKRRGYLAPQTIVDTIEAATSMPIEQGLQFERKKFDELFASDQRGALIHYFFAEREARKIPGIQIEENAKDIRSAAVIGSGTMGGGIAMAFANAGIPVTLVDVSADALSKGLGLVQRNYAISVERGSSSKTAADKAFSLIAGTTVLAQIADVDIVVEAVFENMSLKKSLFADLDRVMKPGAILATNTSSLDIDEIASATKRPEDVIGVHFFSPANVMKLQENVRGKASSPQTIATVMKLAKTIGKVAVLAGNCDGFIGNRMLQYYTGEAEFLLEEGATPEQIDRVAKAFGMSVGPFEMRDMSGIDVGVLVRKDRLAKLPPEERISPILERMDSLGRYGQKSGKGFYRYEGRQKFSDPEALAIIAGIAAELGIPQRTFTDDEIAPRLFAPLVNEGAKELEEGIAQRAGDIDVVWVNGYGFPAFRGGPMYWGELYGLDKIHALATAAAARNGPRWAPGALLTKLAAEGKGWKDATPATAR